MSTSIDERVVQMRFDNKQFEAGAKESMSTLDKLKEKLDFKGVAREASAELDAMAGSTDSISVKFDAMAVIAVSALNRITNAAITTGKNLIKSLSVDQITGGYSKYESMVASTQTLVNATGKSMSKIDEYMEKLMWYSDETSYGFDDMTTALGTMVASGGKIERLIPLLEGMGNATSFVGKGSKEFSRAVIQLTQGYGRNALMYEDWKSIESTLGGAMQLKEVFIEVGEELGKIKKGEVDIGKFNESLKNKWLDQEVMEESFGRFASMTEKAYQMVKEGVAESAAEAYEILSESFDDYTIKAAKAAQEAKTFGEAIDATKDAVSTGWMQTFKLIFGNYREATELWTSLSEELWLVFAAGAEVRNDILAQWKEDGGRDTAIEGIAAGWKNLKEILNAVSSAVREVFPIDWYQVLMNISAGIKSFGEGLKMSESALKGLKEGVKILLIPVQVLFQALKLGGKVITGLVPLVWKLIDAFLSIPDKLGGVEGAFRKVFGDERYTRLVSAMTTIVHNLASAFSAVTQRIAGFVAGIGQVKNSRVGELFEKLADILSPIAEWVLDRIVDGLEAIANFDYSKVTDWAINGLTFVVDRLGDIKGMASGAVSAIANFFDTFRTKSPVEFVNALINSVANLKTTVKNAFKSLTGLSFISESIKEEGWAIGEVIHNLAGALQVLISKLTPAKILVFGFGVTLTSVLYNVAKAFDLFGKVAGAVTTLVNNVAGVFKALQDRIRGNRLLQIGLALLVLAAGLTAMAMVDPQRLTGAVKAMLFMMGGLTIMTGLFAGIQKWLLGGEDIGKLLRELATVMLSVAGAVAILAAAMWMMQGINMQQVIAPLAAVVTTMVALSLAISVLAKYTEGDLPKNALTLVAFALSIKIVVNSLKDLADADLSGIIDNLGALIIAVGLLGALALATKGLKFSSASGVMLLVLEILLFAKGLELIAGIDVERLTRGIVAFEGVVLALVPLMLLVKFAGNEAKHVGGAILAVSASLILLSYAIKQIGAIPLKDAIQGTAVVSVLMAMFSVIIKSHKKISKDVGKLGGTFLAMSVAILLLGVAVQYMGSIPLADAIQGGVIVSAILLIFAKIVKATGEAQKATATIIAMTTAIGILMAAVVLLTLVPFEDTMKAAIVLSTVLLSFGGAIALMKQVDWKSALVSVGVMASVVSLIVGAMSALKFIPSEGLLEKAGSIGIILLALSVVGNKLGARTGSWKNLAKSVGFIAGFLVAATAVVAALSAIPSDDSLLIKTTSLVAILTAVALLENRFKVKTGDWKNLTKTVLYMTELLAAATAVVWALSAIPVGEGLLEKTVVLVAILGMMTLMSNTLKNVGKNLDVGDILKTLGILGGMLAEATIVVGILNAMPLNEGLIQKVGALSVMLIAMTTVVAVLSFVSKGLEALGNAGAGAIKGAAIALAIIAIFGTVMVAIGALFTQFEGLEPALATAENVIPRIGALIGSFFGNIIGGLAGGIASGVAAALPLIGGYFAQFAEQISKIEVSQGTVDSIFRLAEVVAIMSAASFIDSLSFWTGGKTSMGDFGKQLEDFAPHFRSFADQLDGINVAAVTASSEAIAAIADLLASMPTEGGLFSGLTGKKDFEGFATSLETLGSGFASYFKVITDANITKEDVDKTRYAGDALVDLAKKIPASGGALQSFFGEQDIGKFGTQLCLFGENLKSFFDIMSQANLDEALVAACSYAGDAMIALAKKVPYSGGLLQKFLGAQDIGVFGSQLLQFGQHLKSFFALFSDDSVKIDQVLVDACVMAGEAFASFSEKVPRMGGALEFFTGKKDMGVFGEQIQGFGEGLAGFFIAFKSAAITEEDVRLANNAMEGFATIAQSIGTTGGLSTVWSSSSLSAFGQQVKDFGSYLLQYYSSISGIDFDKINVSIAAARNMLSLNEALDDASVTILSKVKAIMDDIVGAAKQSLGITGTYSTKFYEIGGYVVEGLRKGVDANKSTIKPTMEAFGHEVTDSFAASVGVNSPSTVFAKMGMYIVQGLEKGITQYMNLAVQSVIKMGQKLVAAIKSFFGIHSPSTVMRDEVGRFIVDGIAEGIEANTSAEEAAAKKAQNIINAFKDEFDKFSLDATTADLEYQLWESANPNATDEEIKAKNAELLGKKLQYQAEAVNLANLQYQATLTQLGENAIETQQAYNTFLQEQINMNKLASELLDTLNGTTEDEVSNAQKFISTSELLNSVVDDDGGTYFETMRNLGFSSEEIWGQAAKETGWQQPTATVGIEFDGLSGIPNTVEGIVNQFVSQAEWSFDQSNLEFVFTNAVSNAASAAGSAGGSGGSSAGSSIGSGIADGLDASMPDVEQTMEAGFDQIIDMAKEKGGETILGYGSSFADKAHEAIDTGFTATGNLVEKGLDYLGGLFGVGGKDSGQTYVDSAATAIDDNSAHAQMAAENMARAVGETGASVLDQEGQNGGKQYPVGIGTGMDENSVHAQMAAENVARTVGQAGTEVLRQESATGGKTYDLGTASAIDEHVSLVSAAAKRAAQNTGNAANPEWGREGTSGGETYDRSVGAAIDDNSIFAQTAVEAMAVATGKTGSAVMNTQGDAAGKTFDIGAATSIDKNAYLIDNAFDAVISNSTTKAKMSIDRSFRDISAMIARGLSDGIAQHSDGPAKASGRVAQGVITAAEKALAIHSPSRVFYRIGQYIDKGLANGILDEYDIVKGSVKYLTNGVSDATPTITPVVDMSNWDSTFAKVKRNVDEFYAITFDAAGNLAAMAYDYTQVGGSWLKVDRATAQAIAARDATVTAWAREHASAIYGENAYALDVGQAQTVSYNFTQNVTSPKAVSAAEVYRTTKNLFNNVKSEVGNSMKYTRQNNTTTSRKDASKN